MSSLIRRKIQAKQLGIVPDWEKDIRRKTLSEFAIDKDTPATQFRLHLHRGIGYLAADPNIKRIEDLVGTAVGAIESTIE